VKPARHLRRTPIFVRARTPENRPGFFISRQRRMRICEFAHHQATGRLFYSERTPMAGHTETHTPTDRWLPLPSLSSLPCVLRLTFTEPPLRLSHTDTAATRGRDVISPLLRRYAKARKGPAWGPTAPPVGLRRERPRAPVPASR
jgi:hypothetical protein